MRKRTKGKGGGVPAAAETVISIIGPGMRVKGDCETNHTIRIEGVVEGSVTAKKAVVIGREARVMGDITTADAKIAGSVKGTLHIQSRLELAASSVIDGEINTARIRLEEGGRVNGSLHVGQKKEAPRGSEASNRHAAPTTPNNAQPRQPASAGRQLARK